MKLKKLIRNLMSRLTSFKFRTDDVSVINHQKEHMKRKRSFAAKSLQKLISRRHKHPSYRKFDSEPVCMKGKSVRFANVAPGDGDTDNRSLSFKRPGKRVGEKKHKRLRYLKRQARKAAEYIAAGVAVSGLGYGMPPGFNPTSFKTECYEYSEVYTVEQLRWMSNYKKNLYTLGHLSA